MHGALSASYGREVIEAISVKRGDDSGLRRAWGSSRANGAAGDGEQERERGKQSHESILSAVHFDPISLKFLQVYVRGSVSSIKIGRTPSRANIRILRENE
jgi:hypothetical protein